MTLKGGWNEFPRSHIQLEVKLGQGAFGEVYRGELKNETEIIACAVKKLKGRALTLSAYKCFKVLLSSKSYSLFSTDFDSVFA